MADIEITKFDPQHNNHLLLKVVDLHRRCIEFDDALLRFHPPFTQSKLDQMLSFWKGRVDQIASGKRIMILAMARASPNSPQTTAEAAETEARDEIAGMVELGLPEAETGPFRGDVELLMVSPDHRKGGLGRKLMQALEKIAWDHQRTLLVSRWKVSSMNESSKLTGLTSNSALRLVLPRKWSIRDWDTSRFVSSANCQQTNCLALTICSTELYPTTELRPSPKNWLMAFTSTRI